MELFLAGFIKRVKASAKINKNQTFIFATPCHGNLGDQAIVYAEYQFLKKCGIENNIIEVSNDEYSGCKHLIKKYINKNDLIVIDGGGNLGVLWPEEDEKISEIINTYHENKIIIFPQTCYYDDTVSGKRMLEKNRKNYEKASKLTIALRDEKSYNFCVEHFPNTSFVFAPDIVLYSSDLDLNMERKGCLLCFRTDLEKVFFQSEIDELQDYLLKNNIGFEKGSTIVDKKVNYRNRDKELLEKWQEFASARLVITDRLHGMIFAAITGTPCLAVDNQSKKVSGVYQWISQLDYIKICSNLDELKENIITYYQKEHCKYDMSFLTKEYRELAKVICDD